MRRRQKDPTVARTSDHALDARVAESIALIYLALPTAIFVAGWIVAPLGPLAAILIAAAVLSLTIRRRSRDALKLGPLLLPIVMIAALWTVLGGVGHLVYANSDWVVRDAVLVDLVRDAWPVTYHVDGATLVLRAPIGYFLPAAVVGKLWNLAAAEQALLAWTCLGVALTFALMLRDRPTLRGALVRMIIFVVFSGMDIVGTFAHYNPHRLGDHLEWWAYLFQYSSQTTQLFWAPNHALPGWLAVAWLLGQEPKNMNTTTAALFVLFTPLWSPLTAIGIAPLVAVALIRRMLHEKPALVMRYLGDWRLIVSLVTCVVLVYPYLVAGSAQIASGSNASFRWVSDDIVPRYIEFILFEFVGFAVILVFVRPRDPLLWTAIATLLLLPLHRFGPFNDLAMRGSIPALTLLAIELGAWLSIPRVWSAHPAKTGAAILLLSIGAVTPFMEVARSFLKPVWSLDQVSSLVDVTRGSHYLTSPDQPWLRRFLH